MVEKFKIKIPPLTGESERYAYVYLPPDYKKGDRYPVMYMFDGHNLFFDDDATFGKSWGLKEYLDAHKTKIIIAAPECNKQGYRRLEEYSPVNFVFKDTAKIRGRGKAYMDWLVGDFKPFIDKNYPTLPSRENTAIGGSSMGGLMSLYALAKYGKYFSKFAALSPSLWLGGGQTFGFLQNAKLRADARVYIDYGSKEFSNHLNQKNAFAETCANLVLKGVNVTARVVEGGTHCEASWEKQIPFFMTALGF